MSETEEVGLDLSWKSDLRSAPDPGDGGDSDESRPQREGETVWASAKDDPGRETTSLLPSSVNPSELTPTQHSILEAAVIRPTSSKIEVAAAADASPSYVADVVGRWLPDHPAADHGDHDADGQASLDEWGGGCPDPQSSLGDWGDRGGEEK